MEYKSYIIKLERKLTHYVIHHTGKGSLPDALQGSWTSAKQAMAAIDSYLSQKV